ncbi:hypothetical protein BGZ67_007874 [Mortierella alpina]|nr:hypothetical protein BGZ67_007874 [Mortierella alpina]
MEIDDFEEDMILDEDDLIAPSPTGEEQFEEAARFGGGGGGGGGSGRTPNVRIVDKNFFNGSRAPLVREMHVVAFCLLSN